MYELAAVQDKYLTSKMLHVQFSAGTNAPYTADPSPTDLAWPAVGLASRRRGTQGAWEVDTETVSKHPRSGATSTARATATSSRSRPSSTSACALAWTLWKRRV